LSPIFSGPPSFSAVASVSPERPAGVFCFKMFFAFLIYFIEGGGFY
jgi:hypothetical protein